MEKEKNNKKQLNIYVYSVLMFILFIVTFLITILVALIIIPILKKMKVGQIERDDGPESHLKKQGTPTMGGIMMIITIIVFTIIK